MNSKEVLLKERNFEAIKDLLVDYQKVIIPNIQILNIKTDFEWEELTVFAIYHTNTTVEVYHKHGRITFSRNHVMLRADFKREEGYSKFLTDKETIFMKKFQNGPEEGVYTIINSQDNLKDEYNKDFLKSIAKKKIYDNDVDKWFKEEIHQLDLLSDQFVKEIIHRRKDNGNV